MTALPPSYESAPPANAVLLNITPKSQVVDFQTGFLGVSKSSIVGEVQIKLLGESSTSYRAVELVFRGVERVQGTGAEEIELFQAKRTLWSADEPSTSNASALPANLPFDIELTSDLPHCVHTPQSSLEYALTARLIAPEGSNTKAVEASVPVHLTRYAPLADRYRHHTEMEGTRQKCTDSPTTFSLSHPVVAHISLGRTIFRRSEPIELRVSIEPPSADLVRDKGVRLRSVAAELLRVISRDISPLANAALGEPSTDEIDTQTRTVLSRSGKGARFSPTRGVFLRLFLQPAAPLDGLPSCETISQSTIVHKVEFYVRVLFALSGREGDRESIVLERRVLILPDLPPSSRSIRAEKQREAEFDTTGDDPLLLPPVPRYESHAGSDTGASTSTPTREAYTAPSWWDGEDEEEYDGYEEASAGAELVPAPPTIDEDSAPPSLEESDGISSQDTDLNRPLTPSDPGEPLTAPPIDNIPPPEYAGEMPIVGIGQQPPAYSASRRAGEVEVVPTIRRSDHGVV